MKTSFVHLAAARANNLTGPSYAKGARRPSLSPSALFGLLWFGRFFGAGGAITARRRTVAGALRAITARAAMASVPGFVSAFSRFRTFISGSFRAAAAFFGPVLIVSSGFRCGWRLGNRDWRAAFDANFKFRGDIRVKAEFDVVFAKGANRMLEV